MRNLKRALSLTLASVMLLGMMVVGSSAAGFPDVDDADNVEAIEVLQTVKVMVGDKDTGNFRPDSPVSRAEMAVVMANLLNLDYNYYATSCPFNDVPTWARGCVGACYANGIVSGRTATSYDPDATVTAVEAASMMMRALGYFKYPSDYADGFVLSTVRQASKIGLFNDVNADTDGAMTRNQVAQLALNTLESTIVDAKKTSADITVGSGDTAVSINGAVEYIARTGAINDKMATAIKKNVNSGNDVSGIYGETIELGEQLYQGDLEKKPSEDAFGAPSSRWLYKNNEIGIYADTADVEYTTEVKSKDIYKDLGLTEPVTAEYWVDGEESTFALAKSGDAGDVKLGGNGVLIKAYKDQDSNGDDKVTICVIYTYVLQVDGEYNSKKDELQLKTPDGTKALPGKTSAKLSGDDFSGLDRYADEDYVLVTVADEEIQSVKAAETLTETVTAYVAKKGDANSSSVTAGSTYKYDASYTAADKTYEIGEEYVLVLDNYGYVIFADGVDADDQYVYVAEQAQQSGVKADYEADAYFVDGANEVVIVDDNGAAAADHTWFTYDKKASGKYELTAVKAADKAGNGTSGHTASGADVEVVKTNVATVKYNATDSFRANNKTTFVILRDGTVYVYNGIREVPNITIPDGQKAWVNAVMDGSFAKYVFIEAEHKADLTIGGKADAHIYIYDEEPTKTSNDKGDDIYIYKVIKDGELTTVTMSGKNYTTGTPWTLGLYGGLTTDSNGYIDSADRIVDTSDANLNAYKLSSAKLDIDGDVLMVGSVDLVMVKDCKIWVSDGDDTDDITASQFTRDYAKDPFTGALFVVLDDDGNVEEVYIDEDENIVSGITVDPDTTVAPQPGSKDDVADDIGNQDNGDDFKGAEDVISTGLKQTVSTSSGTTTIAVTGTVTPVDLDNAADRKALAVWYNGDPDANFTKAEAEAAINAIAGTTYSGRFALISVNIQGDLKLLIVKDNSNAAERFGSHTDSKKWDSTDTTVCPAGYVIDITGLTFPAP